jgi:hypothetical protein
MEKSRTVKFNVLIIKKMLWHQAWLRPDAKLQPFAKDFRR